MGIRFLIFLNRITNPFYLASGLQIQKSFVTNPLKIVLAQSELKFYNNLSL